MMRFGSEMSICIPAGDDTHHLAIGLEMDDGRNREDEGERSGVVGGLLEQFGLAATVDDEKGVQVDKVGRVGVAVVEKMVHSEELFAEVGGLFIQPGDLALFEACVEILGGVAFGVEGHMYVLQLVVV